MVCSTAHACSTYLPDRRHGQRAANEGQDLLNVSIRQTNAVKDGADLFNGRALSLRPDTTMRRLVVPQRLQT